MTHSTQPISPLRQRMIDDMSLRKLNPKTQQAYLRAVKKLARFVGRSPHTATAEQLRQFQLDLVANGVSLARPSMPRLPGCDSSSK
jgi:integrase/recombinase XerD